MQQISCHSPRPLCPGRYVLPVQKKALSCAVGEGAVRGTVPKEYGTLRSSELSRGSLFAHLNKQRDKNLCMGETKLQSALLPPAVSF